MRVMRLDPSVNCDSNEYTKMFVVSMAALVVCGVGVPALSVVAVHMVRKVSCDGELRPASAIFYFLTGGYRAERWYWEGISLTKKLLLVVVTSVVKDDALRLLCSLWIMTASLLLNAIAQPWEDELLARGEVQSKRHEQRRKPRYMTDFQRPQELPLLLVVVEL
ncbi:membrane-associated protein, putative [Bodo saltans]|uniref:Membrane-associated protein, putative n=1 Tax=Bodo saltans TaxID=75058 RepID=A0A0S4ISV1_BODSA|nr:membrane-associated protein, putative [Bodo saltans]|eukprot:CUF69415.1 membrane-associated protein, putative [Bodo saltans]